MIYNLKNITPIFGFYITVIMGIFLFQDSVFKLNPIFLIVFSVLFLFMGIKNKVLLWFILFTPLLILVSVQTEFSNNIDILYLIQDNMFVWFLFNILYLIKYEFIDINQQKRILYFSIFYIFLYFFFSLDSSLYDVELGMPRYHGITGSTNVSSTTLVLLLIYVWEYIKERYGYDKVIFFIFIGLYIGCILLSKSRSLLFLLPYLATQVYIVFSGFLYRLIMFFTVLILGVAFIFYMDNIFEYLRIGTDSSFNTRGKISEVILDEINNNYFLIPHGHNTGNTFLSAYLGEERYPIHNDFLKIWYEWGGVGIIFICIYFGGFLSRLNSLNNIAILIFVSSSALHNILFLFYVWIPVLFIFMMKNYYSKR